ncbi:MAG: hypothetical protein H6822_13075 [Planctomycetaceae bacterium]|nr:hypothetical protein [Planctomycetales bacterium]MCB9923110.1 hypothetical protein [Planctomycetaceae bacterium]
MMLYRATLPCLLLVIAILTSRSVSAEENWFATADDDQFVIDDPLAEGSELRFVQTQPSRRGRPPVASLVEPPVRRPRQPPLGGTTLLARVPGMFGDFFGGGRPVSGPNGGPKGAPPRGGAATRLVKISENYSPQPRNRIYGTYHYFDDAIDGSFGDVNRYAFGVEHLLWDNRSSFELRIPFAHTLASDQLDDPVNSKDTEFGNITMLFKTAVWTNERALVSTGLGVAVPTADDVRLFRPADRRLILEVQNRAVHLLPFLGVVTTPTEQLFVQSFMQLDIDTAGNPARGDLMAMNLQPLGVVQDPTLLFLDLSVGYWLRNDPSRAWLTGFAPITELHYATTLNDADLIMQSGFLIGDLSRRYDILDVTFGLHCQIKERYSLRPGLVIPLRNGDDRQFDYEVFLQANMTY